MSDELPVYRPRCRYVNSKSMQVYGEAYESDPDFIAGMTDFWCDCTGKAVGPDGNGVGIEECKDQERECFREY
jgi:hypothetical protein